MPTMVSSAVGPITAMRLNLARDNGSRPSFFNSTSDSRAVRRASASCAGDWLTEAGIVDHGNCPGGSNMPRRMRAVIKVFNAVSICASSIRPWRTAAGRVAYSSPHSSSVPCLTASAAACSRVATILWCFQISTIAQQSDTT